MSLYLVIFSLLIILFLSYKCENSKANCLECNDDITRRWLDGNTCPC